MYEASVFPEHAGKTVLSIVLGSDEGDNLVLTIEFTDDTILRLKLKG